MLLPEKAIERGEWDFEYPCGCEVECRVEDGYPIWHVISLCSKHDPTINWEKELSKA